jgi:SAM-dependent methyltransferase
VSVTHAPYPNVFSDYEAKRSKMRSWVRRNYVKEFGLKKGKLLDVACGEGFWADIFAELGFDAYGFDIEPEYIENGKRKFPRVKLALADAFAELPYDPASFDVVFARAPTFFYSYRLGDMKKALTNLLPLVRYGGSMLLSAYSDNSGEKRPGVYHSGHWHHPHASFIAAAEEVGVVTHTATVGNYLQIGMRPWKDFACADSAVSKHLP